MFEYENSIIFEIHLEIYGVHLAKYLAYTEDTATFLIFYNTFIIIYLSIGGPERGYEEYILMTLFFTLAWAIFNAICFTSYISCCPYNSYNKKSSYRI